MIRQALQVMRKKIWFVMHLEALLFLSLLLLRRNRVRLMSSFSYQNISNMACDISTCDKNNYVFHSAFSKNYFEILRINICSLTT
jgi:hypothetical protein